jgi:Skp family chaperone for outer membrane proteins
VFVLPRLSLIAGFALLSAAGITGPVRAQSAAPALTPRIGFVDVDQLLDAAPGRAKAEAGLESEVRLGETRVRLAADSLSRVVDEFARIQSEISPVQREAARLALRSRELQLEDMMQQVTASLDQRRAALQAPLITCVREAIATVQRRDGWHAIVDTASLGGFALVMPEANITARVLQVMHDGSTSSCTTR